MIFTEYMCLSQSELKCSQQNFLKKIQLHGKIYQKVVGCYMVCGLKLCWAHSTHYGRSSMENQCPSVGFGWEI